MASAAAIAGIEAHGLSWKYRLHGLRAQDFGALKGTIESPAHAEKAQAHWDRIVEAVRLAAGRYQDDAALVDKLIDWADENATVSIVDIDVVYQGDPDAWMDSRFEDLEALYDILDYHRVLVIN
ncbi:hypothetical protein CcrBL47_gp317 [Caulobacter phage BL47]|nr:hypothetical protein CcrBL47_gp317 [Caulobacter phage BL47]